MLLTLIAFIIILSILVFVHEFGHFIVAKKTGIKVEEFGFGYPPRIWGKKIGETIYSVNALPVGGFVKLLGEELGEKVDERDKGRTFYSKSKKVRVMALLAGVTMNFILAVMAFTIIYIKIGIPTQTDKVIVVGVAENSPAAEAGLKEKDIIVAVEGQKLSDNEAFIQMTKEKAGQKLILEVKRERENPCQEKVLGGVPGREISCREGNLLVTVVPRENPPEGEGPLGVAISQMEMKFYPFWQMPIRGSIEGFKEAFAWTRLILEFIGQMIFRLFTLGEVPRDVAGPIGIFQVTGSAVQSGWLSVLQFLGMLSVNLMVINILPFPALDGGRLVFIGYEAVTGRRPKPAIERWINTAGMAFLLLILFLVTINDLLRIINTSGFLGQLSRLKDLLPL
jgi:regulator of sigma E protease